MYRPIIDIGERPKKEKRKHFMKMSDVARIMKSIDDMEIIMDMKGAEYVYDRLKPIFAKAEKAKVEATLNEAEEWVNEATKYMIEQIVDLIPLIPNVVEIAITEFIFLRLYSLVDKVVNYIKEALYGNG